MVLTLIACYYMPHNHVIASLCYITGSALDAADGYAARLLNQGETHRTTHDTQTDQVNVSNIVGG